jgi:hypothetical protein
VSTYRFCLRSATRCSELTIRVPDPLSLRSLGCEAERADWHFTRPGGGVQLVSELLSTADPLAISNCLVLALRADWQLTGSDCGVQLGVLSASRCRYLLGASRCNVEAGARRTQTESEETSSGPQSPATTRAYDRFPRRRRR